MTRESINLSLLLLAALAFGSGCGRLPTEDQLPRQSVTAVSALELEARPVIVGSESCAASGCHGRPFDGKQRDWQTAYSVWLQEDPHHRSVDVLYAERSVEMYRNLHPQTKLSAEPPQDAAYREFLSSRCLGCHGELAAQRPTIWAGVGCQSCHGPSGGWLHAHYLTSWPKPSDPRRASLSGTGFVDTANLQARAGVCAGCHVGPQVAGGRRYDVDHELIAAGHPRLAFELDAYLENYPPHWNRALDQERHASATGGTFHVDAWRFGQEQLARQLRRQLGGGQSQSELAADSRWPDFASFRCGDCHHGLSAQRLAGAAAGNGLPRPAETLQLPGGKLVFQPVLEIGEQGWSLSEAGQSWASCPPAELPLHASLLTTLIAQPGGENLDFDRAVQIYLAAQALLRDLPPDSGPREELAAAAAQFHEALQESANSAAGTFRATQYDGASTFKPLRIAPSLARLQAALAKISSSPGDQPSP